MGWRRSVTCRSHRQGPHSWRWPKPEFEARTFLGFLFVFLFSLGGEGSGSEGGTTRDVHLAQRRGPRGFPPTLPAGRTSGPRARAPETPPARREPPSKRRRDWASGGGPGRVRGVGYVARRAGAWKRPGARWGEWNGRWRREFGAPRLLGPRGLGPPPGPRVAALGLALGRSEARPRRTGGSARWYGQCAPCFIKARLQSVEQILCSSPCVERFGVPGSLP